MCHPLGPVLERTRPDDARRVHRWALVTVLAATCLCTVLAYLQPSPTRMGTHTQLGLPPCSWPIDWGIPCPTCGVTTGLAHVVRGQLGQAFRAQPLTVVLGLLMAVAFANALVGLATGRWWRVNPYRVSWIWQVGAGAAVVLAAWLYKLLAMRGAIG